MDPEALRKLNELFYRRMLEELKVIPADKLDLHQRAPVDTGKLRPSWKITQPIKLDLHKAFLAIMARMMKQARIREARQVRARAYLAGRMKDRQN